MWYHSWGQVSQLREHVRTQFDPWVTRTVVEGELLEGHAAEVATHYGSKASKVAAKEGIPGLGGAPALPLVPRPRQQSVQ